MILRKELLVTALLMLPLTFIGLFIGNKAHGKISRAAVLRLVSVLLILSGASLLIRVLLVYV